jgi:hypothetical protein
MKSIVLALAVAALSTGALASGDHHVRGSRAAPMARMGDAAADTSLLRATALVASNVNAPVVKAELQASPAAAPRYDIDVRLPGNAMGRLSVAPGNGEIAWRSPAVMGLQ